MNKIQRKVQALIYYYLSTRGVGHTKTLIDGIDKESVILTSSTKIGKELFGRHYTIVSIDDLDKLRGLRKPLAIDNHAMQLLLCEINEEFYRLEGQVARLKEEKE